MIEVCKPKLHSGIFLSANLTEEKPLGKSKTTPPPPPPPLVPEKLNKLSRF